MIFMKSRGELGNQIFQFGAAKFAARQAESVVLVGFHQLLATFPQLRQHAIVYPYKKKSTKKIQRLWLWLEKLSERGTIGLLREIGDNQTIRRSKGRLLNWTVMTGFFQNPNLIDCDAIERLAGFHAQSIRILAGASGSGQSRMTCFVHVRRGDYLSWPTIDKPAALPAHWYTSQMSSVSRTAGPKGVDFHIFSDDIESVKTEFGELENVKFHTGSLMEDFKFMCSADAGILSASTFSWWAAYFASRDSDGPFIAPRFWLGFREKKWSHPSLKANFLTFVKA